jgi:uncharacterized protein YbjT (DUF2867 family)
MSKEQLNNVLVVGGTGHLGGKVVRSLLKRGKHVRALVRPGSNASDLESFGVETARGDMMDPPSLNRAMEGMDALITTATGLMQRRKADTLEIDRIGSFNLADASKNTGLQRFIFTSVLTCHQASSVPHFWVKKLVEDYLEKKGIPFVALRPGSFLDQSNDLFGKNVRNGNWSSPFNPNIRYSPVITEDVAKYLTMAVDTPDAVGKKIDIGCDRAVSNAEIANILSDLLGKKIQLRAMPWWLVSAGLGVVGIFSELLNDIRLMLKYYRTGQFVADTTLQAKLFGEVPTIESTLHRWLENLGLLKIDNQ